MLNCIDEAHGDICNVLGAKNSLVTETLGDDQLRTRPGLGDALTGVYGDFLVGPIVDDQNWDIHR